MGGGNGNDRGKKSKIADLELFRARESGGKGAEEMRGVLEPGSRAMVKSARFSGSSFFPLLAKSITSPLVCFHYTFIWSFFKFF